jgi:hypothetical protein
MSISVSIYTKVDETTIATAHAVLTSLTVHGLATGSHGHVLLSVYPSAGAKNRGKPPADQIQIGLGEKFDGGAMPTLAEMIAGDSQFATAWNRVARKLEEQAALAHPALRSGAVT